MIIAIHSSSRIGGNLERMVILVAEASGIDFELFRLADMKTHPCNGCVRYAKNKRCIQRDDFNSMYGKLENADGIILGGVNYNGRVNSSAFLFMERLFPLYHQLPTLKIHAGCRCSCWGRSA